MGHIVEPAKADIGGAATFHACNDFFFFAFDARLDGYSRRSGIKPGPDTLEPIILSLYEYAKEITPARFMAALGALNVARRKLGAVLHQVRHLALADQRRACRSPGASTISAARA